MSDLPNLDAAREALAALQSELRRQWQVFGRKSGNESVRNYLTAEDARDFTQALLDDGYVGVVCRELPDPILVKQEQHLRNALAAVDALTRERDQLGRRLESMIVRDANGQHVSQGAFNGLVGGLTRERDDALADVARLTVKLNDVRVESDAAINEDVHLRDGITEAIGLEWHPVPQPLGGTAYVCPDDRDIVTAVREVRKERDEARAALAEAEAAGWRRGMVEASRAVHERGMHLADHDQRLEHDRTELTILAKVTT